MKARQVIIVTLTLLIVFASALIGKCASDTAEKKKALAESDSTAVASEKLIKVKVDSFKNATKPLSVKGFGQVSSSAMISISAEVQGIISTPINLKKGTTFTKGQTLVIIRNEDIKLGLQARKSNYITSLTAILPDLKLDFPSSFSQWQDFYLAIEVDKPIPTLPTPKDFKEKNFIASRGIITEYYSIKSDEERLKKFVITAPFNGSIINAMTDEGAVVNPGAPIISILRDGNLEIEIPVNKNEIDKVKIGATVNLYDDSNISATGKVARIGKYINAQTQTIPIFIDITQSSSPLYNGVYLNAEIATSGFETVMEIPRKAIVDKSNIYIIENNKLKKLQIDIVSYQKNTIYVTGIPDATVIVVEPIINAKEGAAVSIIKTSN